MIHSYHEKNLIKYKDKERNIKISLRITKNSICLLISFKLKLDGINGSDVLFNPIQFRELFIFSVLLRYIKKLLSSDWLG